jgi:hypothetical protein
MVDFQTQVNVELMTQADTVAHIADDHTKLEAVVDEMGETHTAIQTAMHTMQSQVDCLSARLDSAETQLDCFSTSLAVVQQAAAHRAVLFFQDALHRMLRIEIIAAKRYAKDPSTFLNRVDGFYRKHERTCREAFGPPVEAGYRPHSSMSVDDNVTALVGEHVAKSREDLLQAAECQPSELAERVAECVTRWEERTHARSEETSRD